MSSAVVRSSVRTWTIGDSSRSVRDMGKYYVD